MSGVRRITVGQTEAVEVLSTKVFDILDRVGDTVASRRLRRAIGRARTRHEKVRALQNRGFYHGLVTGYAVATKVLQGKVGGIRST